MVGKSFSFLFTSVIPQRCKLVVQGQLGCLGAPGVLLTASGLDSLENGFTPEKARLMLVQSKQRIGVKKSPINNKKVPNSK